MDNISNIENLLPLYYDGLLSKEDAFRVEEWILASEENRKVAKQIEALYLATDTLQIMNLVNTEKALNKVSRKISKNRWKVVARNLEKIAAILLLPLMLLFYYYVISLQDDVDMISVRSNPGVVTSIVLPDGTMAYLNSESELTYPSSFTGDTRDVRLDGEGFFDVSEDAKKHFFVHLHDDTKIEVMGTKFNVEAYDGNPNITTTLIEGTVKFSFKSFDCDKSVTIEPGQKIVYNTGKRSVEQISTVGDVETCWKDDKLMFRNTPILDALKILEKRFGVEFIIRNPLDESISFTGTFCHQHLDTMMNLFNYATGITWRYLANDDLNSNKTRIEIY